MKFSFKIFLLLIVSLASCNKKLKKEMLGEVTMSQTPFNVDKNSCGDQLNYIPDPEHPEHFPIKYIRVNFHVMRNGQGKGNFDEFNGSVFINEVITAANDKLSRNAKMNLPPGNDTPVVPMRYRFLLSGQQGQNDDDGIYFHNDEALYALVGRGEHVNNYDKTVFEKYGIQKDSVLNIFIMTHHLDSLNSKNYVANSKGIGFPNFLKVTDWYESVKDTLIVNGKSNITTMKWNAVKLLHHEIGHTLGLRHTWRGDDGCEDTPNHTNCWNRTKGKEPCDEWWSNNVMDYNAHNSAWTPCQIGIIHRNFSNKNKTIRKLLQPNWCMLDESKTINIQKDIIWKGAKDLEGHLIIEDGATLTIFCRVAMPKDARLIIHPQGKLILDGGTLENDCGDHWNGIEIWSNKSSKGEVTLFNQAKILHAAHQIKVEEKSN